MKQNNFIGVILAAGMGTRLKDISRERGKVLPEIAAKPLIHYAIDFMRELGAAHIFVVGGYVFSKLQELLKNETVKLRYNQNYEGRGNIFSLLTVLPEIESSFLMMNVDHIYNRALVPVIKSRFHGITAFCDFDRPLGMDDMKVSLIADCGLQIADLPSNATSLKENLKLEIRNLKLSKMSKKLTDFNCGYVGMTYVDHTQLEKYKKAAHEVLRLQGDQVVVENILAYLAQQGESVHIGDISGYGWLEIDTPEEFHRAEKAILENQHKFIVRNS